MAALTWREVSAPQIDIRNFMGAGQSITGAFDKLGQMFVDRENRLRGEATDEAIARVLASRDRDAVIDPSMFGKRVNAREVLAAQMKHRGDLLAQGIQNETLMNSEADAKHGYLRDVFAARALAGQDVNGAIPPGLENDPLFNRARRNWDFTDPRDRFIDNTENDKHNRAQEAASMLGAQASMISARASAAESQFRLTTAKRLEQERIAGKEYDAAAERVLNSWTSNPAVNSLDLDTQIKYLRDSKDIQALPKEIRDRVFSGLKTRVEETQALPASWIAPGTRFGNLLNGDASTHAASSLQRQQIERQQASNNPGAYFTNPAKLAQYKDATPASVLALAEKSYNWWNDGPGRYQVRGKIRDMLEGENTVPAPLVMAVLSESIKDPANFGMIQDTEMLRRLERVENAWHNQGEALKGQQDLAGALAPYQSDERALDRINAQIKATIATRAGKAGDENNQAFEAQLKELTDQRARIDAALRARIARSQKKASAPQ